MFKDLITARMARIRSRVIRFIAEYRIESPIILLDWYIARQVVGGTLVALAALVGLFTFIDFIDDLNNVGKGDYKMAQALEYIVLTTPRRTFGLFPLAALVGALIGLGTLASSSELIVMRSAGMSALRISMSVMGGAAILVVIAMFIGEVLAPIAEQRAQSMRSIALSDELATNTRSGFWVRDGNSFINIRKVSPGGRMQGVYIYEFDDNLRLRVATRAKRAQYQNEKWLLEKIVQSQIEEDRVVGQKVPKAEWNSLFEPDLINVVSVKPESLSILGLRRYIDYLGRNGLDTTRFKLALWHKFTFPASSVVMILLAIPLVLGRLKAAGLGQRILVGVIIGIGFNVLNQASGHMGLVYGLSPGFSAVAPVAVFLVAALVLLRRVQ